LIWNYKMASKPSFVSLLVLAAFLLSTADSLAQDQLRDTFFKDADAALVEADAVDAQLLAPRSYDKGSKAYAAAEAGLNRGRNVQYLRDKTAEAASSYGAAKRAAELAKTVLAQVLKSRQDAFNARANELSKEIWDKANREFAAAIRYLERGDLKSAKRKDILATSLYRDAELVAIKAQYLTETRRLLADADKRRVGRYAPFTLNKAKQLLADAERELEENRYDTDYPRNLAQQANYEAKHAFYLADVVLSVRDKDLSVEMLVLQWEEPLRQIAGAADVVPAMSDGHEGLRVELVAYPPCRHGRGDPGARRTAWRCHRRAGSAGKTARSTGSRQGPVRGSRENVHEGRGTRVPRGQQCHIAAGRPELRQRRISDQAGQFRLARESRESNRHFPAQ
jgi:hypothetical protein